VFPVLFFCFPPHPAGENNRSSSIIPIVSTGNTCGIFEPCRCPTNPYGGIPRRVTWVNSQREDHPDLILIDSGDVFDPKTR
jgi:2',3'-cyclic-nucleotide 2'-phosphodiesterase (5'-nucleotidase family)